MDFVDATILHLADETLRPTVFDSESLSQLVAATHDVAGAGIEAPFAAVFDELSVVFDSEPRVDVAGSWMTMGHTNRTEVALQAAGIGAPIPRIDLLAAGAITATARGGGARITTVEMSWLELAGIDREITPLPTDPAVLEQRRRERLLARIRARLDQPARFDDAALGRWLTTLGVASVTELMTSPPTAAGATLQITFDDGPDEAPRRRRFPFAIAFLVRVAPLSLAGLLDETRRLRPHLQRLGFGPAGGEGGARMRRSPIVAWVLPATLFDDDGWPGATTGSNAEKRAQRRRWASAWLARERTGLIVPPM